MKKRIIHFEDKYSIGTLVLLVIILLSCTQKTTNTFTIEGIINGGADSTEISLYYLTFNDGKWQKIFDKTFLINNRFFFQGDIHELCAADLVFDNIEIPMYLEPADIKLVIDKDKPYNYEITGLKVEKENSELRKELLSDMLIYNNISNRVQIVNSKMELNSYEPDSIDNLIQQLDQLKAEHKMNLTKMDSVRMQFALNHSAYQIVPYLLYQISRNNNIDNETVEAAYNKLPEHSKTSLLGKLAFEQIKENKLISNRKEVLLGDVGPDFSREGIAGDTIRLSDFKDKTYVLLDFWASWCGPCLKEIPQLKMIYSAYHKKDFTIIGVSSDENKQEWVKAVENYEVDSWLHVFSDSEPDNNYFPKASDIDEMYGVKNIPLYVLIDKKGKVIGKWQHIDDEMFLFLSMLEF